jgi:hypothetical protein
MLRARSGGVNVGGERTREHRGKVYSISPAHPCAELLDWMTEPQIDALAADLRDGEQRLPTLRLPSGVLIDGRNRELACLVAGVAPWYETLDVPESAIPALVASLNINRRHLSPKRRRALAVEILRAQPERSNRDVARTVGLTHPTVATVRAEIEGGKIYHPAPRERAARPEMPSQLEQAYKAAESEAGGTGVPPAQPDATNGTAMIEDKAVAVTHPGVLAGLVAALEADAVALGRLRAAYRRVTITSADEVLLLLRVAADAQPMPAPGVRGPWETVA